MEVKPCALRFSSFDNVACRHIIRKCPHALLDRLVKELSARAAPLTVGCELYASNSFWQALFFACRRFSAPQPTKLAEPPPPEGAAHFSRHLSFVTPYFC